MNILVCSLSSVAGTIASGAVMLHWSRHKNLIWDEYYPLLRQFDWEEAKLFFDNDEEDKRKDRDLGLFRHEQRRQLEIALELVGRAYHNNRLSRQWIGTEWRDMMKHHLAYEPEVVEAMRLIRRETGKFRRMALYDLAYMWLLSLLHFDEWRFMPVPSVVARRKVFNDDILQAYERVRLAVANFASLAYSEEEAECVLAKM
jgi:hypothetical protein